MAARKVTGVYVISIAAELSGMHPQTLRIYERKGLLLPERTGGGSRRYSDEDVALLRRISELTSEGMNLVGVKRILDLERRIAKLEAELAEARSEAAGEVQHAIEETQRSYRRDLVPLQQSVTLYKGRVVSPESSRAE
jgi:MerR family transcriptional regulator/heat shock protein HspR